MLVHLQGRDGPHVVDATLYSSLQGTTLSVAVNQDHHLLGSHHRTNTYCQGRLGHQVDVVIKETAISNDGVGGQGLLTRTAGQTRTWLIESDMAIRTDATQEQVDATKLLDLLLIVFSLGQSIWLKRFVYMNE